MSRCTHNELWKLNKQTEELAYDYNSELEWKAVEACHVFICVAKAKLSRRSEENQYPQMAKAPINNARSLSAQGTFDGAIQGERSFWNEYEDTTLQHTAVNY